MAIQDTCYISYKTHKKTKGLGIIAARRRSKTTNFETPGLVMHTSFAITTDGLPLGLLDQKIHSRAQLTGEDRLLKKNTRNTTAIEDKESIKWIESLKKSNNQPKLKGADIITVCDREADIYDLFKTAIDTKTKFLVRARQDRTVNKKSLYSKKTGEKLWSLMEKSDCQGEIKVNIPARDNKPRRTADLELRFSDFKMSPPMNIVKKQKKESPSLKLNAIYVKEKCAPAGEEPMSWMLLTNMSVVNIEEVIEKVKWYCLRWRIEVFHKILKSGLKVEECRLGTSERLIRYLKVMSIIAWRIFFITLIARSEPKLPCTSLLSEKEYKVLYRKINRTKIFPDTVPTISQAITWIAQLGGFLARKCDGDPGPITLWRGWKRLFDLVEGWDLALSDNHI